MRRNACIFIFFIASLRLYSLPAGIPDSVRFAMNQSPSDSLRVEILVHHILDEAKAQPAAIDNLIQASVEELQKRKLEKYLPSFYQSLAANFEKAGDYFRAIDLLGQADEAASKHNDPVARSLILNKTGNIYLFLGDFTKALENHFKSLSIKEELNDEKGIAASLSNIGNIYFRLDSFILAHNYYTRSLQIEQKINNPKGIASCYINLGAVFDKLALYDSALFYLKKSIEINSRFDNKADIASSYINIANIYDKLNYPSDSIISYFKKAEDLYSNLGMKSGLAETWLSMGVYYNATFEFARAKEYLLKALDAGRELRSAEIVRRSAKELSDAYAHTRDFEKAYTYFKLYKQAEDRISNDENIKKLTQLEMQHTFDRKQREQEFLRQQERRRQMIRTGFILIALLFVTILALVIYRSYRIKQKDNILLAQQKEEIAAQRDLVMQQRDQIQRQKEEITDSIHYASRIQQAILPPEEIRAQILPEHFILFKPRDIVSGDFYWITRRNGKTVVTAADCTGHGVPGAFMSMLGVSFLNEIVNKEQILHADQILNRLREQVIRSLHQTGREGESKDGMDISLLVVDDASGMLEFAGAYNPCYIVRNGEVTELKADRMPIGIYSEKGNVPFSCQTFQLQKDDSIYLSSDGYEDQFGGPEGKKLKAKAFKDILLKIYTLPASEQLAYLDRFFGEWRNGYDQVDDVLVIGIKIP